METLIQILNMPTFQIYAKNRIKVPTELNGVLTYPGIRDGLEKARSYVKYRSPTLDLVVLDGTRPLMNQAYLHLVARNKLAFSGADAETVSGWAHHFAANPMRNPNAGHIVGGAVDVVLMNSNTGEPYEDDLKSYDSFSLKMRADYFDLHPAKDMAESTEAFRRVLVREAMQHAGFTGWNGEFCHFEMYTPLWSERTGLKPKIFGIPNSLKQFQLETAPYQAESDLMELMEWLR